MHDVVTIIITSAQLRKDTGRRPPPVIAAEGSRPRSLEAAPTTWAPMGKPRNPYLVRYVASHLLAARTTPDTGFDVELSDPAITSDE